MNRAASDANRAHGEEGFTLVELMIAIAILAIIVAPLSLAVITGLRVVGKADQKYNDSRGSLISAAYFANDVSNANTITKGGGGCGGPGTPIVSFAWTSATDPASADVDASPTSTVTYTYDPSSPSNRLLRESCGAGGAGQSVAAISLGEIPVVTCYSSNPGGSPIENGSCDKTTRWVKLEVTAAPNSATPDNPSPTPYTFTLEGTRRPT